jgi:hypothetical protein
VNPNFAKLPRILSPLHAATGLRVDCTVRTLAELDALKMDPFAIDECNTHSTAAFDFFLWSRGFWTRMLADRGGPGVIDMFIGEAKWDGLMVHLSQPNLTEVTGFHLLLHVAGLPNPAAKGWRAVSQRDMDLFRNNSSAVLPDNVHNAKTVCRLTLQDPNWGRCRMRSTVYEAAFQLCPSGAEYPIEHWQRKVYRSVIGGLNWGYARQARALRQAQSALDALQARINASQPIKTEEDAGLLAAAQAEYTTMAKEFLAAYPPERRLRNLLGTGSRACRGCCRTRANLASLPQWRANWGAPTTRWYSLIDCC